MKLYLVRHGETDWNVKGMIQGSTDTSLNDIGLQQADELSQYMLDTHIAFSKIYTSPQVRALKTAEILSKHTGIESIIVKGLEEINLGMWEGLSWSEVKVQFPNEYRQWCAHRRYTRPPKGESYDDMLQRVLPSLHTIIKENDRDVVIVTHSAVIMCIQCYLTHTPFTEMRKFKTDNVSITEIDGDLLLQFKE